MKYQPSSCNPVNIWGEGLIFGFSGMDGETLTRSGFVMTLGPRLGDFLIHTPRQRVLRAGIRDGSEVRVATGDLVRTGHGSGQFIAVWSAWHTLIGGVPAKSRVWLGFVGGRGEVAVPDRPVLSHDPAHEDWIGLLVHDGRFAVAYGRSEFEVRARLVVGLRQELEPTIEARLVYVRKLPVLPSSRWNRLLHKCASVMKVNVLSPEGVFARHWSTPDRVPHRHMWLWDSVFHSFAMNHLDPELSHEMLCSILDTAAHRRRRSGLSGMISHCMRVDGDHSVITQPPLLAWGILENARHLQRPDRIRAVLPALGAYLDWNLNHRDQNHNGLLEWFIEGDRRCRCGESGLDNSSRFDSAQLLDAVDFSAQVAHDLHCLAELHLLVGRPRQAQGWRTKAQRVEKALHSLLWSESDGFYYDRDMQGNLTGIRAVSGFFPLMLKSLPGTRLDRLVLALHSNHFATVNPVASLAKTEPGFGTDMWRGPVWLCTNYLVHYGLQVHGRHEEAARLRRRSLEMVAKYYERHGVLFEYFDAMDRIPPSRCFRKGPPDRKPYLQGKVNVIRDYHWTAAVTYCFLMEEFGIKGLREPSGIQSRP